MLPIHDVKEPTNPDRLDPVFLCVVMNVFGQANLRSRSEERLVEPDGFEPTTSGLQSRRSPS